jgi:cyclophilin family peptidyl-prolyl cis-trans isomerase
MVCFASLLAGCGDDEVDETAMEQDTQTSTQTDSEATDTLGETDTQVTSESQSDTGPSELMGFDITDRVELVTNLGTIVLALFGHDAPITTANFLVYVDEGFFDGLIFHRVIPDFMIQGGGYDEYLDEQAAHDPIALEIVEALSHQKGVISMARTNEPNSATSQFFICVEDKSKLDGKYAAFGATLSGYEVAEDISLVETHTMGFFDDVPVETVFIESARRL